MTTILTPVWDETAREEAKQVAQSEIDRALAFFRDEPIGDDFRATLEHGTDNFGRVYRDVVFLVQARYWLDGDLYIQGGGFAINISRLIAGLEQARLSRDPL